MQLQHEDADIVMTGVEMRTPLLSRRAFLGYSSGLAAWATSAGSLACRQSSDRPSLSLGDLTELSATAAVAAMRNGDVTAEAYAQALLTRVQRLQYLNAFRLVDYEKVLESARAADKARAAGARLGLLHGLPIPVKDSVNTAALPTSNGTRMLEHFRPRADAAVLTPLLAQGAYVMGKTNLHELSLGFTSTNPHFGAVRNPYNAEHVPGGSSGGSGAAVAARMAPLAIAEDTGGSIRVPAAWCGICGLRPTYARYPNGGIMPLTQDKFDQVGAVARSVEDLALFDTVLTGEASPLPTIALQGTRLGIPHQLMTDLHPDVARIIAEALKRLEAAGVTLVRVDMPEIARVFEVAFTILFTDLVPAITGFLEAEAAGVKYEQLMAAAGDDVKAMPPPPPPAAYAGALKARADIQQLVRRRFAEHDIVALVYPAVFEPAPRIGDTADVSVQGRLLSRSAATARSTLLAPCCGLPGLVLTAGVSASGLPIGIEFDGLPGTDRELLALGRSVEKALGPVPPPRV